jgi:hypothetical protein
MNDLDKKRLKVSDLLAHAQISYLWQDILAMSEREIDEIIEDLSCGVVK